METNAPHGLVTRIVHMGLSIRGFLRNCIFRDMDPESEDFDTRPLMEMTGCVKDDNGRRLNDEELFEWLCDELAAGHEMVPFGQCDAWDYKTGCPGHERTAVAATETPA